MFRFLMAFFILGASAAICADAAHAAGTECGAEIQHRASSRLTSNDLEEIPQQKGNESSAPINRILSGDAAKTTNLA